MSSAAVNGQSAPAADSKVKSPLQPVAVFEATAARVVSPWRPAVLAGLSVARFPALVEDPVWALKTALPAVVAIQLAYAIVCLPVAGSQQAKPTKKPRPGEKKKQETTGPNLVSTCILSLLLTIIATPVIHLLFVLFGAPFLDHVTHTLLCAAHFAMLAVFPIFYSRGVDGQAMLAYAGAYAPLDEVFGGLAGAVIGAWLGAVPIPLDWDREWQKWPVTIVMGMYFGYSIGARFLVKEDLEGLQRSWKKVATAWSG